MDAGDVSCVQLRLKDVDDDAIRQACDRLQPICRERDVAFILNDRADLAKEMGCDGVHVGEDDAPYAEARRIVGADAIVGVSCYASRHSAMIAGEAGADYVAFGAFYKTETKAPRGHPALDTLRWWNELMEVPCVAIGGIKVENCRALAEAGADFVSVITGVWNYPQGPAQAVRDFNAELDAAAPPAREPETTD